MAKQPQGASAPVVFSFNTHSIRTIDREGEVWFVAADVCEALGLETHVAIRRLDEDEKGRYSAPTPGGDQEVSIINESGLYALVLGSRKAEAKQFKRWVTHEVLPAIRQTGSYTQLAARINRRAWALAQGHYDTYRDRMRRDTLIKAGHATPEEWEPLETTQDVLELLEMQAITSENNAASLRQRGKDLASIVGKDYSKAVEKFHPPKKREKQIK